MLLYGSFVNFPDSHYSSLKHPADDAFGWQRLLALAVVLTAAAAAIGLIVAGV